MRYRQPYVLFPRPSRKSTVWYFTVYNESGKRVTRSTGIGYQSKRDEARTRREAKAMLDELAARGRLTGVITAETLDEWVARHSFWDWRRSTYVRGILKRSDANRAGITESYIRDGGRVYANRIAPAHGARPLGEITAADCEELLFDWTRDVSHKTANNYRSYYSVMLGEAVRLGDMTSNPWDRVPQLAVEAVKRGGLTLAEGARIVAPDGLDDDARTRTYHLATKLAFLAGLRIGEVCGLMTDDVRSRSVTRGDETITMHYLDVSMQYNPKVRRRVPVKDKDARAVPITPNLVRELEPRMTGPGRYLFSFSPDQSTPITANRLREWMYSRMDAVGIDAGERATRNLSFHSTRRFFNTLLRRSVSGDVLRKMTGHGDDAMTEHYTDYLPEDLQAIADAQASLTEPLSGLRS